MHARSITEVGVAGRLGLVCLTILANAGCDWQSMGPIECADDGLRLSGDGKTVVFVRSWCEGGYLFGAPLLEQSPMLHSLVTQRTLRIPLPEGHIPFLRPTVSVSHDGRFVTFCAPFDPGHNPNVGNELFVYDIRAN